MKLSETPRMLEGFSSTMRRLSALMTLLDYAMESTCVWVRNNKSVVKDSASTNARLRTSNFRLAWKKIRSCHQEKEQYCFSNLFDFTLAKAGDVFPPLVNVDSHLDL